MPTELPRITFTLTEELREHVDDYKFTHRCKNQTAAINDLIMKGIEALSAQSNPTPSKVGDYSHDALMVATKYEGLDDHGKRAVRAILDVELERIAEPVPETGVVEKVYTQLRFYDFPAAAGKPTLTENAFELERFPADVVPDDAEFAVKLDGDSMEPDYPNGCTVFVKPVFEVDNGDIIIAWLDEETGTVCKQVVAENGKVKKLVSLNPSGPTYKGAALKGMRVYGKVLGRAE